MQPCQLVKPQGQWFGAKIGRAEARGYSEEQERNEGGPIVHPYKAPGALSAPSLALVPNPAVSKRSGLQLSVSTCSHHYAV